MYFCVCFCVGVFVLVGVPLSWRLKPGSPARFACAAAPGLVEENEKCGEA